MATNTLWNGRRVVLTGHTGFKGSWLALYLDRLGADVTGIALEPDTQPSLFSVLHPWRLDSRILDIRNRTDLALALRDARPEIVIHMAAQSLVLRSYREPIATFETNVLGTAYLLDALRGLESLRAVLVVTSDKVYENTGDREPFKESAPLGGTDPYSASKAAAEVVTRCMSNSYFAADHIPVLSARAGNVVGGGDWSADRLIPDLWRAAQSGQPIAIRHPNATRPWQHVLEPLTGYLLYVAAAIEKGAAGDVPSAMNFGPSQSLNMSVEDIARSFSDRLGHPDCWYSQPSSDSSESQWLAVDAGLAHERLGWTTKLSDEEMIAWTVEWYKAHARGADMRETSQQQISDYMARLPDGVFEASPPRR